MAEMFLRHLAKEYVKHNDLCHYSFIFPNRRAGVFFAKELKECATGSLLMPEITTINTFVSELTGAVEVNRVESLFMLYEAYKSLDANSTVTFERFSRWGDVLLSDFGDIDRYMVDAKDVFVNISDLKSIKANYLTDEVKEILSHYFNLRYTAAGEEEFWQHIENVNGETVVKKKFASIWGSLYPLYVEYNRLLSEAHLTYNGKMYRDVVEVVKGRDAASFNCKRYVFIGFNVLSKSEYMLFKAMRDKGIADFHWDYESPAFATRANKATKFLSKYVNEFKAPFDNAKIESDGKPKVLNAVGVPSTYGQAQCVAHILKWLVDKGMTDGNNAIDTAVVLPNERLFMPVIKAIDPKVIGKINVTMGLSLRNSSIATLISAITKMHFQAKTVKGVWQYFHADVKDVLLHPIVKFMNQNQALALINQINRLNMYNVPYQMIEQHAPALASLFTVVSGFSAREMSDYLHTILQFTQTVLERQQNIDSDLLTALSNYNEQPVNQASSIEMAFLNVYADALEELRGFFEQRSHSGDEEYKVDINTFCYLLDRLVGNTKMSLEGEPLGGLQVMGVLETRCLDFKNLIILSMNERVFPRKHFTKSFIPQQFRRAYDMSTIEHQESMYAYYFYRMISRAENVYMLYDSRSQAGKSGEESRFIHQLSKLFGKDYEVKYHMLSLGIEAPSKPDIMVKKDKHIMDILNLYKAELPDSEDEVNARVKSGELKLLSAHSINCYITCPMHFYLRYVEGLPEIDDVSQFMQASTFGTIVHNSMQRIYPNDTVITTDYIDNLLRKDNKMVQNTIIANINKEFLRKGDDCYDPLQGESLLKFEVALELIERILEYDRELIEQYGDIHYVQGEKVMYCTMQLGENKFNLSYTIDRLDKIEKDGMLVTRIVDYKTGQDKTEISSPQVLFEGNREDRPEAILQLLLYCNAYALSSSYNQEPIEPIIYKLIDIKKSGLKVGKEQVLYPSTVVKSENLNQLFVQQLGDVIDGLFDENTPFVQTTNEKNCKYCKFKDFCRKEDLEYGK
ncbi:MAG: PD-(D/E)XK nuclease family protein [Muribaculaceae bacterium]